MASLRTIMILAAVLAGFRAPSAARAAEVTYVVDPARSSLSVTGTFAGYPLQPQAGVAGAMATTYTGLISAQRDPLAHTLQISGGDISAVVNGTSSPLGIGYSGHTDYAPADYGFTSPSGVTNPPSTTFAGALCSFSFSISGPAFAAPELFDVAQLSTSISSGEFYYAFAGPGAVVGFSPANGNLVLDSDTGTLIDSGGVETLSLPVSYELTMLLDGQTLDLHFSGTIVATDVPEPASLAILLPCLVLTLAAARLTGRGG